MDQPDQVLVVELADGTSEVTVDGSLHVLDAMPRWAAQEAVTSLVAERAAVLGRPVRVLTRSVDGGSREVLFPSGTEWSADAPDDVAVDAHGDAAPQALVSAVPEADRHVTAGPEHHYEPVGQRPWGYDYPAGRGTFLREASGEPVAAQGWRGIANALGLRLPPDEAERAARAGSAAVAHRWVGPRTVSVINPKGGAGKTPSTAMLAATFARHGGAGVLAWENNQTRGTLGWRTEETGHRATSADLMTNIDVLLGTGARAADLAGFVHHQHTDLYDVLRSRPLSLASEERATPQEVDALHELACRYYRMIVIDTGDDESEPTWLRAVERTDQVVVPTTTRDDHAEAGALLLEALADRDERSARLAAGAVVVVSQADPRATTKDVARVVDGFRALAREVVTVPYDPSLVDGQLRLDALRPATRRAWLAAAAAVARGL